MLIPRKDAKEIRNSSDCIFWEYDFPSKRLGVGTTMIAGRYPEAGWAVVNKVCDEVFFVVAGRGAFHDRSGRYPVSAGDLFFLPKGRWYWLEGHVFGVASTSPPFKPRQHQKIRLASGGRTRTRRAAAARRS